MQTFKLKSEFIFAFVWAFIIVSVLGFFSSLEAATKKIDETWGSRSSTSVRSYSNANDFKGSRKMGLQTTLAGATGLLGLNINLNFAQNFEFSMGFGISRGFRSLNAHVKTPFGGKSFSPYFVAGYSRWSSGPQEGGVENTSPSVVANKFLSPREKQTGEFAENILYPGLGLQYLQLSGDMQGFGVFAEILMLVDIDDFVTGPTAGVGGLYYF